MEFEIATAATTLQPILSPLLLSNVHQRFKLIILNTQMLLTEMCFLMEDIHHYYNVAQGKITIPGVDDAEENLLTDVSNVAAPKKINSNSLFIVH